MKNVQNHRILTIFLNCADCEAKNELLLRDLFEDRSKVFEIGIFKNQIIEILKYNDKVFLLLSTRNNGINMHVCDIISG